MMGKPVRLSQSPIWQTQRDYFVQQGIEAWRQNVVPSYITSNSFIAHAYAQVVLAYMMDCAAQLAEDDQPLYIVELGAGSGKFAFHFLTHFLADGWANHPICYVMTDISEANIRFWQNHEQFRLFVAQGVLDFAMFDALSDRSLTLRTSGHTIGAETQRQRVVAIANYVFDGLPMDVFEVKNGRLYECLVSLTPEQNQQIADQGPHQLHSMALTYQTRLCNPRHYTKNTIWRKLLRYYAAHCDHTAFSLPTGSWRAMDNLLQLANGRLFLLSADKGYHHIECLQRQERPKLVKHGSFSFRVNYHALAFYAEAKQAEVLQTPHHNHTLDVVAFLFDEQQRPCAHTHKAYQQHIVTFGPDDFYLKKRHTEQNQGQPHLADMLSLLRLSHWDTDLFLFYYYYLVEALQAAADYLQDGFVSMAQALWRHHFHLNEQNNIAFELGALLASIGFYEEALPYFRYSQNLTGNAARTEFNMALCFWRLGLVTEAMTHINHTLALEPDLAEAIDLQEGIERWQREREHLYEIQFNDPFTHNPEGTPLPPIHLEPLAPKHAARLYQLATPEVRRQIRQSPFANRLEATHWVNETFKEPQKRAFVIHYKQTGLIGCIILNVVANEAELVYWLGEPYWGNGYMPTALEQFLPYAAYHFSLEEIRTCVLRSNTRSIRVLEKLHFTHTHHDEANELDFYRFCLLDILPKE